MVMTKLLPLHRFEQFGLLSEAEREAVLALPGRPYTIERGQTILRENDEARGFYLLLSGWAAVWNVMPDGGRQIAKIHLPGEPLGTPSMAMRRSTENVLAITEVVIANVPLARFGALFETHPRVAARFLLSVQQERIVLMDRLAAIGRVGAEASVASFLLDIKERLEPLGLVQDNSFDLMVTQEQIGDVLGLTSVHVNRVLSSLTSRGLIERNGRHYRLPNADLLSATAARPERQPFPDQDWLPAAR